MEAADALRRGDTKTAELKLRAYCAQAPSDPVGLCNLAKLIRAREAEATALLERAVALEPRFYGVRANLATLLSDRVRFAAAEHALRQAVRLRAGSANVVLNLALATTGVDRVDFRITDAIAEPPGVSDALNSERLVRIAPVFLCFSPPAEAGDPSPPPCLATGQVTFGSFNNIMKLSPSVVATWSRVAGNLDEYVEIAVQLATDHGILPRLRSAMRARPRGSPLMDLHTMALALEHAYREAVRARSSSQ